MTARDDILSTLDRDSPPDGVSPPLAALWWEAKGDWEQAHRLVQDGDDAASAWVHAYLHRREGDLANAAYWYRRAVRPLEVGPLDEERRTIAAALSPA